MKITGTPHPDGSCAWRAGRAGHEDRIGVARNRYTPNPLPEWWAWCGRCNWVPLGPGEGLYRTWQEAQDAAAAHAGWHLRSNAAIEWSRWDEGCPTSLPPDLTPSLLPGARHCCAPHGLICTRLPGHTGRHAAGDGDMIVAVWND